MCMDTYGDLSPYKLSSEDAHFFDEAVYRAELIGIRISTPSHIGGKKLEKTSNWDAFSLKIDKYFPHFCEDCNPDVDRNFCPYPWIQAVIESNGDVVACCQRKIKMGNFSPDVDFIKDVWNNESFQQIRSLKDFHNCDSPCNMINFSIWGGELRLDNIPEI